MKISVCQFSPVWGDCPANLALAEALVSRAEGEVVLLPEMFATGFVTDNPDSLAQTMAGPAVEWMRTTARLQNKAIAGSLIIAEGHTLRNRMLFAHPDGRLDFADKRHLFSYGGEDRCFSAGTQRTVVEYKGVRFLLLVCYDLRFPVWSRRVVSEAGSPFGAAGDYDVILYAASWPASRGEVWRTLLKARAMENQAYVAGANRTGSDPTATYAGDSAIISPRGEVLTEGRTNIDAEAQSAILTAEIDPDALKNFREKFPASVDADAFELK